jgi:cytoskeletal protein RodZ
MAKKVKKAIKPKKKSGSKKKSNSFITKLIVIIFVLILAFFLIFSVFKPGSKIQNPEAKTTQVVENQQNNDIKPIDNPKPQEEPKEEVKEDVKQDVKEEPKVEVKTEDKSEGNKKSKKEEQKAAETKAVEQSITGTWMSTTEGAVLTMGNNEYRLDFMGVDSGQPLIGTYSVEGDLITFVNKKDPCKDVKGLYVVKFNKQEIGFKCKSDDCTKRKATLPTDWEWLDTED